MLPLSVYVIVTNGLLLWPSDRLTGGYLMLAFVSTGLVAGWASHHRRFATFAALAATAATWTVVVALSDRRTDGFAVPYLVAMVLLHTTSILLVAFVDALRWTGRQQR